MSGTIHILVRTEQENYGWYTRLDNFRVRKLPTCVKVSGVEATKQTGTTVSAGAEDVLIASLKVTTVETEPALAVKELQFNTNNTNTQLANCTTPRATVLLQVTYWVR